VRQRIPIFGTNQTTKNVFNIIFRVPNRQWKISSFLPKDIFSQKTFYIEINLP
jgi:hypothetical protein